MHPVLQLYLHAKYITCVLETKLNDMLQTEGFQSIRTLYGSAINPFLNRPHRFNYNEQQTAEMPHFSALQATAPIIRYVGAYAVRLSI